MKTAALIAASVAALTLCATPSLRSEPPKGMSTVKLAAEGLVVELTLKDGSRLSVTAKGTNIKPGEYFVKSLIVFKNDEKKNTWRLVSTETVGNMGSFTVEEGQEKVLDPGPPVVFHLMGWRGSLDKPVNITLTAKGKYDEVYYPGAWLGNQQLQPPAFQIVDEQGKVLQEGRFTYARGTSTYPWTPPKGFTGKYKVMIKPALGPFEWKLLDVYGGAGYPK